MNVRMGLAFVCRDIDLFNKMFRSNPSDHTTTKAARSFPFKICRAIELDSYSTLLKK